MSNGGPNPYRSEMLFQVSVQKSWNYLHVQHSQFSEQDLLQVTTCYSLLAEVSHDEAKWNERREKICRLLTSFSSRMSSRFLNNQWRFCHVWHNPGGVLTIWRENPEISVWSQIPEILFGNCGVPSEVLLFFRSERNGGNFLTIC